MNIVDIDSLSWQNFEDLCIQLIKHFRIFGRKTASGKDGGVDIIGEYSDRLLKGKVIIQCKKYSPENKIGRKVVQELFGNLHAEKAIQAIIITTSYFTPEAQNFAADKPIRLINRDELISIVNKIYEKQSLDIKISDAKVTENLDKIDALMQKDLNLALNECLSLIDSTPNCSDYFVALGAIYLCAKEKKLRLQLDPNPTTSYFEKIEEAYLKSVALNPHNKYAHLALAELHLDNFEKVTKILSEAYDYLPNDEDILFSLIDTFVAEAEKNQLIHENVEHFYRNWNYEQRELLELKNRFRNEQRILLEKSLDYANSAIKIYDNAVFNFYKGKILFYLSDEFEAKKYLFKSVTLDNTYQETVDKLLDNLIPEKKIEAELEKVEKLLRLKIIDEDEYFKRSRPLEEKLLSIDAKKSK